MARNAIKAQGDLYFAKKHKETPTNTIYEKLVDIWGNANVKVVLAHSQPVS